MADEQTSYPALDFALQFGCAWLLGALFHRFSGESMFGQYPYAAAAVVVCLAALPSAWQASLPAHRVFRAAVPFALLVLFYTQGTRELGIVGSIQDRVGPLHVLLMFLATFFAIQFTPSVARGSKAGQLGSGQSGKDRSAVPRPPAPRPPQPSANAFDRLIGQEHVVTPLKEIANVVRSGLRVGKKNAPHAVLLFLGPTGVGKTEAARALAQAVFGREDALIRFDMGQFTDSHQASRFYGPPPGYVGYEEGGQLTRAVQKKPKSVVLLDEVEKAHSQIWDAFLPVFDEGYIVDGSSNQKIDMTNTIIVLTSNLLAGREGLDKLAPSELKQAVQETNQFRPELIGRINEILVFKSLQSDSIEEILRARLDQACWSLSEQGISISAGDDEIRRLVEEVKEAKFGVRQIDDVVRSYLRKAIAEQQGKGSEAEHPSD